MRKLLKGPARAVIAIPDLGWRKWRISTGTGFAQPNPAVISKIKPSGSMWCRGFMDTRPCRLAVSSPRHQAAKPCPISWKLMHRSAAMAWMSREMSCVRSKCSKKVEIVFIF